MYPTNVPPISYLFYAQPINSLPNAPMYPNYGPIGLFADSAGCITPFVCWIENYPLPDGLKMPFHVGSYDRKLGLDNYLHLFKGAIHMQKWTIPVACHMFTYTLKDSAQIWLNKGFSWDNKKVKKKNQDRFSPYKGSNHGLLTNLSKSPREILATKKVAKAFGRPPRMVGSRGSRDMYKYLKGIKKEKAKAFDTQIGEWKKGDKDIVPVEAPILMISKESQTSKRKFTEGPINGIREITFPSVAGSNNSSDLVIIRPSIRSLRVDSKIPLVGFSGEHSWPLREVPLDVTVGESPHTRTETLNFVIVSGIGTIFSTNEPNKVEEGHKKFKETILEVMKDVLSCVDAEERIIVNDKYPEQTVVIGKQLPTNFKRKLQDLL
ncbi:hypothetical protein Tco_0836003 [Tanacetum coccineum]